MQKHITHIFLCIAIVVTAAGLFGCNRQQTAIEAEPTEAVAEPTKGIVTPEPSPTAAPTQEITPSPTPEPTEAPTPTEQPEPEIPLSMRLGELPDSVRKVFETEGEFVYIETDYEFASLSNGAKYTIESFQPYISEANEHPEEFTTAPESYAIIDLDRDGKNEIVCLISNVMHGLAEYLILSDVNGKAYGYVMVYRGFVPLLLDGSAWGSSGASVGEMYRFTAFTADGYETETLAREDDPYYEIAGSEVSAEQFHDFCIETFTPDSIVRWWPCDSDYCLLDHQAATFPGLLSNLGISSKKHLQSYDYICENGEIISGKLFNTASYYLDGYLGELALKRADLPLDAGESAVLIFKNGEKEYRIRLSDKYLIVYDKDSYDAAPIAVYSYSADAPDMAELRQLLFREEQTVEYLKNTRTAIPAVSDALLKTNTLYSVDLDSDGTDEELYVAFFGSVWNWSWGMAPDIVYDGEYASGEYIYVNKELQYFRKYAEMPLSELFGLTSFEPDGRKYIITYDDGPSDDPCSMLYMFKNGKIEEAGEVYDCLFKREEKSLTYTGLDPEKVKKDSVQYSSIYCLIQMWNEKGTCGFDPDGHLVRTEVVHTPVVEEAFDLLYPVNASENPDGTGVAARIEAGKIFMDATDGVKMVHIKAVNGSAEGWIDVENPEMNLDEEYRGKNISGHSLFSGYFAAG